MFDTRQLEVFATVARTGSFSAAARLLHCSQPAVSQQMRTLERQVGGPLFVRTGRGLHLTEAGRILAERGSDLLDRLATTHQQVSAIATHDIGTIRICAFPSANVSLVPAAAAILAEERPQLRLELVEEEPPDSFALLRRGEVDLVLSFSYLDEPQDEATVNGMLSVPLLREPLALLVPAGHRLAGRERVSLTETAEERWIAGCVRCQRALHQACAAAGFVPDITCSTDDNLAIQSLVTAGLGVALVPRLLLSFLQHPGLTAVEVESAAQRLTSLYTWPDLIQLPIMRATVDALISASAKA
ncbi:DNA-binding transcriptional regulator, LysR family [Lentzea albidocapillata subsp. violacea]|uniref:DNA-binding transcriptional regulator, LysR family n=1 Tax=Lentzea albidocapillata subsp. violacea TaxID=128104 RepID=A0A1G9QRV1_9PSEU|nr:LysR family transcriptional regulator [Lentzea albidocapillata]SDM13752.1 DNA-binding transcriptional regulator, LysR family [Lentzea albidocapillata subsp. violacea]